MSFQHIPATLQLAVLEEGLDASVEIDLEHLTKIGVKKETTNLKKLPSHPRPEPCKSNNYNTQRCGMHPLN